MDIKDILYDEDIIIYGGDIKVGISDQYHINDIIEANKGQYYQWPDIGYGINKLLSSQVSPNKVRKEIRDELRKDGYRLDDIIIDIDGEDVVIDIDAKRIQ